MLDLNTKAKQFLLGTSTGFSLAMVFPVSLAIPENEQAVLDSILGIMPVLVVIVVSLAALTATITFLLGIRNLSNNVEEEFSGMEFSALTSAGGIVVAFANGLTSFHEVNIILATATTVNIIIFLVSFAWNCAKFIHRFLVSRE